MEKKSFTDSFMEAVNKAALGPVVTNPVATGGLQEYNLESVIPQYWDNDTPLLPLFPRISGQVGSGSNWKFVRRLKGAGPRTLGTAELQRGSVAQFDQIDRSATYKTLSLETAVSYQAQFASQGLTPQALSVATEGLMKEFVQMEHSMIINGNATLALGKPADPVVAAATGGALTAGDYRVAVVALTGSGYRNYIDNGGTLEDGLVASFTKTAANGINSTINGGVSQASDEIDVTLASGETAIEASVADVAGAVAYAWFFAADAAAAGALRLAAVTNVNKVKIVAAAVGTQTNAAFAVDRSLNDFEFDGIISQLSKPDSFALVKSLEGSSLTATGTGGIVEFDAIILDAWRNEKIEYTHIFCNADTCSKVVNILLASPAGQGAVRTELSRDAAGNIVAGNQVVAYRSSRSGSRSILQIVTVADLPEGVILFYCDKVNTAINGSGNTEMHLVWDYKTTVFPMVRLAYDTAISIYGCLAIKYGAAWGMLKNVG